MSHVVDEEPTKIPPGELAGVEHSFPLFKSLTPSLPHLSSYIKKLSEE